MKSETTKKKKKKKKTCDQDGDAKTPKKSRRKGGDGAGAATTHGASDQGREVGPSLVCAAANFGSTWRQNGQSCAYPASSARDQTSSARRPPSLHSAAGGSPRISEEGTGWEGVEWGPLSGICFGSASEVTSDREEGHGGLVPPERSLGSESAESDGELFTDTGSGERVVWVAGGDLGERDPSRDQSFAAVDLGAAASKSELHRQRPEPLDGAAPAHEGESPKKKKKKKKEKAGCQGSETHEPGAPEGSSNKKGQAGGARGATRGVGKAGRVSEGEDASAADDACAPGRARGYDAHAAVAAVGGQVEGDGAHGWQERWDALDGRKLYFHVASGTKQYVKPPELARFEEEEEERRRGDAAATAAKRGRDSANEVACSAGDPGPFKGVAGVFVMRRCGALLETLRRRAPVMEKHFLLRSHPGAERRSGPDLERAGRQLRMSEEKVRSMCAEGEGACSEGPAIRGSAQEAVGVLVIFNSKYARTDCLRHYQQSELAATIGLAFSPSVVVVHHTPILDGAKPCLPFVFEAGSRSWICT